MRIILIMALVLLAVAVIFGERLLGLSVTLANYCYADEECVLVESGPPDVCGRFINRKEEDNVSRYAAALKAVNKLFKKKAFSSCRSSRGSHQSPVCEYGKCVIPSPDP